MKGLKRKSSGPFSLRLALAHKAARRRTIDFPLDREDVMANDKSIELRVSLLEHQMETLLEIVKEIRDNYVTRKYLDERLAASKEHLDERLAASNQHLDERLAASNQHLDERLAASNQHLDVRLAASKEHLDGRLAASKEHLDERLSHYATKEDLERVKQNMRNWVITVGISATALQFAMQYALFQLYMHAR
jgi:uncharacterized protein YfiM (DUF2279 family)